MSDRALHDRVIRYLTDAPARAAGPVSLPITPVEADRAGRFANFLARHYYRDRLARSFQYSYGFREQTGRSAEQVADSAEFDAFLPACVLGSLASAQRVGEMARQYLLAAHRTPWWESLVEYEYAYFLQAATSELAPESQFPSRGPSAVLKRFEWRMPELLSKIRAVPAEILTIEVSALHQPVMLLFSRNREGR